MWYMQARSQVEACQAENRGKYNFRSNGPVLCSNWNDRKAVYFVSSMHRAQPLPGQTSTVMRQDGTGSSLPLSCPPLLPDYIAFMRGVDRGDQLVSYYSIGRKSKKWWRKIFFYLIDVCILNALVMYSRSAFSRGMDMYHFKMELAYRLVDGFSC